MLMSIDEFTIEYIYTLIRDKVVENRELEFKQEIPRPESLIAQVCAFANTGGGFIVLGVSEDSEGYPSEVIGFELKSVDSEIQKINNFIRTGLEPRIIPPEIASLEVDSSKYVIVIRVVKSWASPHRSSKDHKFYGRTSSGKYPLDVGEIRAAMINSEHLAEKIRKFKADRIIQVMSGETYRPMGSKGKMLVHLIPVQSFTNGTAISISEQRNYLEKLCPMFTSGYSWTINLDGHFNHDGGLSDMTTSYVQVYRNGSFELCSDLGYAGTKTFDQGIETRLTEKVGECLDILSSFGLESSVIVFTTFVGVEGYRLKDPFRSRGGSTQNNPLSIDVLPLPEVALEERRQNIAEVLKPSFDVLYNAFGYPEAFTYNPITKRFDS